jgi:RHS repeat-associated protein
MRRNSTSSSYGYDAISRLSSLGITLGGSGYSQQLTFQYNPASQLSSKTTTNTLYAYTGYAAKNLTYGTANSLNQIPTAGTASLTYDTRGNLASTGTGGASYGYDQENNLTSTSGGATLTYDPIDRLHTTNSSATGTTQFLYDGSHIIAEYNSSGVVTNRYVFGPGGDEPLVWYPGSGTSTSTALWTIADNRGSIIAVTNASGTPYTSGSSNGINIYDEYGVPASTNLGRFQYTGQAWVPETALYHYKARTYNPSLGRFLQTDPAGYSAGMNLYAYVGGQPSAKAVRRRRCRARRPCRPC